MIADMKLLLTITSGTLSGQVFDLESGFMTVGRGETCTVRFDPLGERIASKQHAFIEARPDGYYIADNNSTNGTIVNGERSPALKAGVRRYGAVRKEWSNGDDPDPRWTDVSASDPARELSPTSVRPVSGGRSASAGQLSEFDREYRIGESSDRRQRLLLRRDLRWHLGSQRLLSS
jgi:hypothetical protein